MKTLSELMNLKEQTALITGGGGHIGSAIAEALGELGAEIILVDMNEGAVKQVANRINQTYDVPVHTLTLDLEDHRAPARIRSRIEQIGRLNILVNCAAFVGTTGLQGWVTDFENQSVETWRRAVEVNLTTAFALAQACTQFLRASGHGSIINISSIYGMVGPNMALYEGTAMGNPAAYAASKGGLIQLTRWLATVLAPEIRVNSVSPGGIARNQPDIFQSRYIAQTPLRRMGTEEDLKGAAAYLACDLSAYVTGQNLVVDGGWTAW